MGYQIPDQRLMDTQKVEIKLLKSTNQESSRLESTKDVVLEKDQR